MKKLLLITLSLAITIVIHAQEEKQALDKKVWLGGTGGFSLVGVKDAGSTFKYNVGPSFGFMVSESSALGINIDFTSSTASSNNGNEDKNLSVGYNFQPFFRHYFGGGNSFKFYYDLVVSFGGGKTSATNNQGLDNETKYGTFGIGTYMGAQYWFNSSWSMASSIGLLGYDSRTNNKDGANESKTYNFGLNATFSTLNFSLFYHF